MQTRQDIKPRNINFDVSTSDRRWWHSGSAEKTIFFDALSIMFPYGERFFMDSVRNYATELTDPALKADVKGFLTQEAIHSREHVDYNARLERLGYPAQKLEAALKSRLDFVKRHFGHKRQLAVTCALEHFTAILAYEMLSNPAHLEGADAPFKHMWQWHALEEAEHRSVAFNVYRQIAGHGLGAWFMRVRVMLIVTVMFNLFIWGHVRAMMKADGLLFSPVAWGRLANYLLGKPGMLRRIILPWAAYFKPRFHPQSHGAIDDADKIEQDILNWHASAMASA
jgi:uncharacterized protein